LKKRQLIGCSRAGGPAGNSLIWLKHGQRPLDYPDNDALTNEIHAE